MSYEFLDTLDLHNIAAFSVYDGCIRKGNRHASEWFPDAAVGDMVTVIFPQLAPDVFTEMPVVSPVTHKGKRYTLALSKGEGVYIVSLTPSPVEESLWRGELLKNLDHTIREALSASSVATGLLQQHMERLGDERAEKYCAIITHGNFALQRVANNLTELRMQDTEGNGEPVELMGLLSELVSSVNFFIRGSRREVEFKTTLASFYVKGNRDALERMFLNVLSNSIKASPEGTPIVLTAEKQGKEIVLAAADKGSGIPQEKLGTLFSCYSMQKEAEGNGRGLGIGFSAVYAAVRRHGGSLLVTSKEGVGTKVILRLPETELPDTFRTHIPSYESAGKNANILAGLSDVLDYKSYYSRYTD